LTETDNILSPGKKTGGKKRERRSRLLTATVIMAVIVVVDILILTSVVPWAEEISENPYMSLGYVVTFLTVFANFLVVLGIVAYIFHGDSYPSDHWK
jgi:type II secretory pathway component PulF